MLPKLCHLDNDLEIIIIISTITIYYTIYCVVHMIMTYISYLGTFFFSRCPSGPWPVIRLILHYQL